MNRIISVFLILVLACIFFSCKSYKEKERERLTRDSISIVSFHPSRPFIYGYPLNRRECEKKYEYLKYLSIKPNEVVADVGAASGWLDGVISVFVDSVIFYVQDIDTMVLNDKQLGKVVAHFSNVREKPQSNTFNYVIGETKQTNLPDSTFDLITIHNTFHEISNPIEILFDLKKKLKRGGRLVIYESFSNAYERQRHKGCRIKCETLYSYLSLFKDCGFYLTNMVAPPNSLENYLTFQSDSVAGNLFDEKLNSLRNYIRCIDTLNHVKAYKSFDEFESYKKIIEKNFNQLSEVFPMLEDYFYEISLRLSKKRKFPESVWFNEFSTERYPESPYVSYNLGLSYMKYIDYVDGLYLMSEALKKMDETEDTKKEIQEIEKWLKKLQQ
jgi:ubiquinone/menaquinone biosynthesis C-methylase UbiE